MVVVESSYGLLEYMRKHADDFTNSNTEAFNSLKELFKIAGLRSRDRRVFVIISRRDILVMRKIRLRERHGKTNTSKYYIISS